MTTFEKLLADEGWKFSGQVRECIDSDGERREVSLTARSPSGKVGRHTAPTMGEALFLAMAKAGIG